MTTTSATTLTMMTATTATTLPMMMATVVSVVATLSFASSLPISGIEDCHKIKVEKATKLLF